MHQLHHSLYEPQQIIKIANNYSITMRFISQARIHLLTFRLEFLMFY
jgi:hypothetical protein